MPRGRMYPRCSQCDKLFSEKGYLDDSITLSNIEAFPYCSECIKKNRWKKCCFCNEWGDYVDGKSCLKCHLEEQKRKILEESQKNYEEKKNVLEEKMANLLQQRINEAFACRGTCGRIIPLEENAWIWPKGSKDLYCKSCITNKLSQENNGSNSSNVNCSECNFNIATGDNHYSFPNDPSKIICQTCKDQFELSQAYLEVMKQGVDLTERINKNIIISTHRTNLLSAQKIIKGEPVNIDNLVLDEDDKHFLRELQQQYLPQNNNSSNYSINCQNCGEKYEISIIPSHCQSCQSRNIKIYNEKGFLQTLPKSQEEKDKKDNDTPPYPIIFFGVIFSLLSYLTFNWWRKRKTNSY